MEKIRKSSLSFCLKMAEKILDEAKNTKDLAKRQEILPSWQELNRFHAAISSLLEFRQ